MYEPMPAEQSETGTILGKSGNNEEKSHKKTA